MTRDPPQPLLKRPAVLQLLLALLSGAISLVAHVVASLQWALLSSVQFWGLCSCCLLVVLLAALELVVQQAPAAVSLVDLCPYAEAQEVTGQCLAEEMALWSHCYSCLRLSTCFKLCGHQSLEQRPRGLKLVCSFTWKFTHTHSTLCSCTTMKILVYRPSHWLE